jgi:hypothetical protein
MPAQPETYGSSGDTIRQDEQDFLDVIIVSSDLAKYIAELANQQAEWMRLAEGGSSEQRGSLIDRAAEEALTGRRKGSASGKNSGARSPRSLRPQRCVSPDEDEERVERYDG